MQISICNLFAVSSDKPQEYSHQGDIDRQRGWSPLQAERPFSGCWPTHAGCSHLIRECHFWSCRKMSTAPRGILCPVIWSLMPDKAFCSQSSASENSLKTTISWEVKRKSKPQSWWTDESRWSQPSSLSSFWSGLHLGWRRGRRVQGAYYCSIIQFRELYPMCDSGMHAQTVKLVLKPYS